MWSKGAVIIKIHGDKEMGSPMADSLFPNDNEEIDKLKCQNFFLRRRSKKATDRMIRKAKKKYGRNYKPPEWASGFIKIFALIEYSYAMLVEKVAGR